VFFSLPPHLPPLPSLPLRGRDLVLLLVAFFTGFFGLGMAVRLLAPEGALQGLLPVISLMVLPTLFMLFLVWLIVLWPYRLRLADLGLRPTYSSWYRIAVAVGLLCVPVFSALNLGVQSLFDTPVENPQLRTLAPEGFRWTSLGAMLLLVGVLVPFVEEIVFRGLIFGWLRKHLRFALAAPLSAIFFGSVHMVWFLVPVLACMGLVLAAITERSGSLWPAIIVHGTFNSLMTITFYTALAGGAGL
jgi:membrane protease YdiL (CAAX protease family)